MSICVEWQLPHLALNTKLKYKISKTVGFNLLSAWILRFFFTKIFGNSLAVHWLGLGALSAKALGKVRPYEPSGAAKKKCFFLVYLRYKWHMALCKFKVYSLMIRLIHIKRW